jgi:hypothetical protein
MTDSGADVFADGLPFDKAPRSIRSQFSEFLRGACRPANDSGLDRRCSSDPNDQLSLVRSLVAVSRSQLAGQFSAIRDNFHSRADRVTVAFDSRQL